MTLESTDLEKALKKKGFEYEAGDHKYYRLYVDGRATSVKTKVSHGPKHTLSSGLVNTIKKQMGLSSPNELKDFVECPLERNAYVERLKQRGVVKTD